MRTSIGWASYSPRDCACKSVRMYVCAHDDDDDDDVCMHFTHTLPWADHDQSTTVGCQAHHHLTHDDDDDDVCMHFITYAAMG